MTNSMTETLITFTVAMITPCAVRHKAHENLRVPRALIANRANLESSK